MQELVLQGEITMVALKHLRKFVNEHPQYFPPEGRDVLKEAEEMADGNGTLGSGLVENLLGTYAQELFSLMSTNTEYLQISLEAAAGTLEKIGAPKCPHCQQEMRWGGAGYHCTTCDYHQGIN